MTNLLSAARLTLRSWRKSPGFTVTAIVSIALGIGANTAIFTLVDHVLLRVMPVQNAHELVQVTFTGLRYGNNWGDASEMSYPVYTEIRDHNDVFSGVFARFGAPFHIGTTGATERVAGEIVSGSYFPVLGVGATLGRTLTPEDDRAPGAHPVAVLSHGFWTSRFAADPRVLNTTIVINSHPYTIVGVARAGFTGIELGRQTQVFVPMMMKAQLTPGWSALDQRLWRWVRVFARLRPGVTLEQARASLDPYFREILARDIQDPEFGGASRQSREEYLQNRLVIEDASRGRSGLRRSLARPLWILMATAAGVLLIGCANVASLLIARGAARQREIAVRLALGATRRRIAGQLLVESSMLALAGGLLGLAVSIVAAPAVLAFFVNPDVPLPVSISPDWRILLFTFGVSTLTGMLFGLAPAFHTTRPDLAAALKDQSSTVLGGRSRLRKALVATQMALSLLLLIGASLFLRTLDNLLNVDVGFGTDRLISFSMDPSLNGYEPQRARQFARTLLDRLQTTPGVEGAGLATMRLLDGFSWNTSMTVEGSRTARNQSATLWANSISPGYFAALGIPLLAGRDFTPRDELTTPPVPGAPDYRVAIVNERFVRRFFGDDPAIGKHIGFGGDPNTPTLIEIVGVVRDSKYTDIRDETQPQVFFPFFEMSRPNAFTIYLRTTSPADAMFSAVRSTVRALDRNLPIHTTRTLERQVAQSLSRERLVASMSAAFGIMATLLAVVGLYGVMAYSVARRTREIGVRVALGASTFSIGWLVIREAFLIAASGIALGLPAAWWLSRFVGSQLYGVEPHDPLAMIGAVVLLVMVALLAGIDPSTRAARLDPTVALRQE
jgi:putative ABC transport system permease protein